ncbi:MAG: hypothetical protein IKV87_01340 [Methanobrevibacter sp.]|nr:hypothetical protein [Methanobrevibacter sp.]
MKIKNLETLLDRMELVLSILIILDILFLISSLLLNLNSTYVNFILIFDTILCIVLICTFIFRLNHAEDRVLYFKENFLDLFASVPLSILLMPSLSWYLQFINVVILIRFLRMLLLLKTSFKYLSKFFNATYLDKIVAVFIVIIVGSTFALQYFDPAIPDMYYSLWYVFQTITTVGYGDVIPESPIGQFIGLMLVIVGVLMFSVFTASFSYIFNDKVFKEENEEFNEKVQSIKDELREYMESVEKIREKTSSSNEEIFEIKEKLAKSEENIKNLESRIDYLIELVEKKE